MSTSPENPDPQLLSGRPGAYAIVQPEVSYVINTLSSGPEQPGYMQTARIESEVSLVETARMPSRLTITEAMDKAAQRLMPAQGPPQERPKGWLKRFKRFMSDLPDPAVPVPRPEIRLIARHYDETTQGYHGSDLIQTFPLPASRDYDPQAVEDRLSAFR